MTIAIIGGGIGGLATAMGLQKIGIKANVYEQNKSFKPLGTGIGIGSNVMIALHKLGIGEKILELGMSLNEQQFLNGNLKRLNSIDFTLLKERFGEENITIERAELHNSLFRGLNSNHIHFNKKVKQFKQIKKQVELTFTDGSTEYVDYVIAADGIHSIFRQTLIPKSKPRYAGYTCWRGITKNENDVSLHLSTEIWSERGRFGYAPLANGDVYWFACINAKEKDLYYQNLNRQGVATQFGHLSSTVTRLVEETYDDHFLHHDLYDIKPIDTFIYDRVCLLGDAAHATTPNMGQGAGQAIEDASELVNAINSEKNIKDAFILYSKKRVPKTKKIINLSRQIGSVAQWDNEFLIAVRNLFFPFVPSSLLLWRLNFLYK